MSLLRKTLAHLSLRIPSFLPTTSTFLSTQTHLHSAATPLPQPTSSTAYDQLIATAGRDRDLTTLHSLLNRRFKEGFFNTAYTFNFLTQPGLEYLRDLLHTLSTLDQGFARKNAFDSLILHLCRFNRIEDSIGVIDFMIEKRVEVNPVTFHPLLNAVTRKKRFEEAWGILDRMKGIGLVVDITSYNFLISSYCVTGDLAGAAQVMQRIREEGVREDMRTYDALVMGACRVGKVDAALVLLRRMLEDGIPFLHSTHGHVIKSLVGLGCFAHAVEFVMAFARRDVALDNVNFAFLLNLLIKRKRMEEAKFVFGEMEKRGLVIEDNSRAYYNKKLFGSDSKEI